MKHLRSKGAVRITLMYVVLGCLWILLSDYLLAAFVVDLDQMTWYQTFKGFFFVAATALLLYIERRRSERTLREKQEYLSAAAEELRRVNRALSVLSESNQVLVRASNESDLLNRICHILVETGDYRSAWVGYTEGDKKRVQPAAYAGSEPSLLETGRLTDVALRTGQPALSRDVEPNSNGAFRQVEAARHNQGSSIALPLIAGGLVLGTLTIHAPEPDAFDADEVTLLVELANDLAYGISSLRIRVEREETIGALRQSEERYRELVEMAPDAIAIHCDEKLVFVNSAAVELLGADDPQQLIGTPISHIIHPNGWEAVEKRKQQMLAGNSMPYPAEDRYIRLDGTVVPVEVTAALVTYQGKPAVQAIVRDITERKRTEEALQLYTHRLETLHEIEKAILTAESPQAIAQAAVSRLAQLTDCQRISVSLYDFETQEATLLAVHHTLGNTKLKPGSRFFFRRDPFLKKLQHGRIFLIDDTLTMSTSSATLQTLRTEGLRSYAVTPLLIDDNLLGSLNLGSTQPYAFATDQLEMVQEAATQVALALQQARLREQIEAYNAQLEQKVAERTAELAVSEERYRILTNSAPQVIWMADTDGKLVFLNPAWRKLTGYRVEVGLGDGWTELLDPDDRAEVLANWENAFERGETCRGECRLRTKDGAYHTVTYLGNPVKDARGQIVSWVGIDIDITDRVRAEAALKAANADLETFAYSVSHDLRAPLRAINGFARIIAERYRADLNPEGRHYFDNIIQASQQMGQLIDDLLAYSRLGRKAVTLQLIPLAEILSRVVERLEPQTQEAEAQISLPAAEQLPTVQGDRTLLTQIFTNLLQNALTYRRPDVPLEVQFTSREVDHQVVVAVRDNGIGIAPDYQEKIFNVFQRLHSQDEYSGTGIGLAVVKKSVELLQGEVGVESAEGEGSTFWVKLSGGKSGS